MNYQESMLLLKSLIESNRDSQSIFNHLNDKLTANMHLLDMGQVINMSYCFNFLKIKYKTDSFDNVIQLLIIRA